MAKTKNKPNKKEMSDGMAIAVIVLSLTAGGIVIYYLLRFLLTFFFPGIMD